MKKTNGHRFLLIGILAAAAALGAAQQGGPGGPGGGPGRGPGGPGGPGGRGGSAMMIIRMASVQTELHLTQEQIDQVNALKGPMGGPGRGGEGGGERQGPPPGGGGFGGDRQGPPPGEGRGGDRHGPPPGGGFGGDRQGPPPGEGRGGERPDPLAKILNATQKARLKQLSIQFDAPQSILDPRNAEQLGLTDSERDRIEDVIRDTMPRPEPGQERPKWSDMMAKKAAATKAALAVLTSEEKAKWAELTGVAFTNWQEPKRRD